MPNRRTRSRRREKILGMSNQVFFTLLISLFIIIALLVTGITINKIKEQNKFAKVQEQKNNEVQQIYDDTNNHLGLTDNYRSNTIIRLSAVGEINFDNQIENNVSNYDTIFENIKKCFKDSDLVIGTYNAKIENEKEENFAKSVKESGVGLVSLCTENYTNEAKEKLQKREYQTTGTYDEDEQNRITIIEKRKIKIAIIAYSEEDYKNGINVFSKEQAKEDLEYAKENAIVTIVMMNFKEDNNKNVSETQKEIAKYLVDNGADAVIGTSKSSMKKMDMLENRDGQKCLVVYSLGDYVTDSTRKDANIQIILNMQIYVNTNDEVSIYKVDYTPVYLNDFGKSEYDERYKLFDTKYEIAKYESEHDENSKNQVNNSEETVDDVIDKETYKKIKEASEKIKEIIQGE